jgi:hypothetical protein
VGFHLVVIELFGGLGNQMFQYAFGKALALKHGTSLKVELGSFTHQTSGVVRSYALNCFKAQPEVAKPEDTRHLFWRPTNLVEKALFRLVPPRGLFQEKGFHFQGEALKVSPPRFYRGHWQSHRYFEEAEDALRADFQLRLPLSEKAEEWLSLIHTSQAVSLHVRRGDYVRDPSVNRVHGACTIDYYRRAAKMIEQRVKTPTFFVFSDDIPWAKDNLDFLPRARFVEGLIECEDLALMSACLHQIIANSSFSWWGAWLNPSTSKTVIAPKKWFQVDNLDTRDLLPSSWLTL